LEDGRADRPRLRRKLLEAAGWLAGVALLWTVDTMSKLAIQAQNGWVGDHFRLITEQWTSAAGVLAMIPFVAYWLRLFPLRRNAWLPAVLGHVFGTAVFAFGHYSLQVVLRAGVYGLRNMPYIWREPFVSNLVVEYQKDIKIYLGIVVIISAYRYWRATVDKALPSQSDRKKLIVQTGTGEAVIRYDDIRHLEASRNYVVVHTPGKEYLIRDTLSNLERTLPAHLFARAHRSHIVNVERISEIRPVDGSYRIRLDNGAQLPMSRSYRDRLKAKMAGESAVE